MTSKISVVIPAFNARNFLVRAVESVVCQTGIDPPEIVLVDDCSTDGTSRVIRDLKARYPTQIVALSNTVNLGPGGSRNRGFAAASGDWLAILDADDAFAPDRLARLVQVAEREDVRVIADLPILFDLAADAPEKKQLPTSGAFERLSLKDFLRPDPETGFDFGMLQPVFHRSLADEGLLAHPEDIRHGEDFALYMNLLRHGVAIALLREAHYLYSTTLGSVSGQFSPGSVTNIDFHQLADYSADLLRDMRRQGDLDEETEALLVARIEHKRWQNRVYGWTALRKGNLRRLALWLKNPRNGRDLLNVLAQKARGKRGLPD